MCRGEAFIHSTGAKTGDSISSRNFHKSMEDSQEAEKTEEPLSPDADEATTKKLTITQALRQGEAYGVRALFEQYVFSSTLTSGACVSEILFLSRSNFRRTCRLQLDDDEFAASTQYSVMAPSGPSQRRLRTHLSGVTRGLSSKTSHLGGGIQQRNQRIYTAIAHLIMYVFILLQLHCKWKRSPCGMT